MQIYKIYMNQSVLNITEILPNDAKSVQVIDSKGFNIKKLYQQVLQKTDNQELYLLTKNPKKWIKKFCSKYRVIKAAGGIVKNNKKEFLFIYRLGKWDLPKGKLDKKEKTKHAAIREVQEECGVKIQPNIKKLRDSYHIYLQNNHIVIKKTSWYAMKVKGNPKLIPQLDEGITDAKWVSKQDVKPILKNTYSLIEDLTKDFIKA